MTPRESKKQVPFSVAIGKVEFMQKCFPKHLGLETARIKYNKEIKEGKKRRVSVK